MLHRHGVSLSSQLSFLIGVLCRRIFARLYKTPVPKTTNIMMNRVGKPPDMTDLKIRRMEPSDVQPCAQLMAITPLWQRYGVTLESATARLSGALQESALIFVAEGEDAQVLGFVWVVLRGAFDI